jgi:hypothetical protein
MENDKYYLKYLKYKNKYINFSGGRLKDAENSIICDNVEKITENFDECNKLNECYVNENNFAVILAIADAVNNIHVFPSNIINNIILNHHVPLNNVIIITLEKYIDFLDNINKQKKIIRENIIFVSSNDDFLIKFSSKLAEIAEIINFNLEKQGHVMIYNLFHGADHGLRLNIKYNDNSILFCKNAGRECTFAISREDYINCLLNLYKYKSECKINILLVNNNCFTNYILHLYIKYRLISLEGVNKINLLTYSIKPYIKYLFLLFKI